jgi:hypothetical protein
MLRILRCPVAMSANITRAEVGKHTKATQIDGQALYLIVI